MRGPPPPCGPIPLGPRKDHSLDAAGRKEGRKAALRLWPALRGLSCPSLALHCRIHRYCALPTQARLGILAESQADADTDDGDDAFSIMERLDVHLMRSLENMHSPSPWVRQSVVLSLSAVHGTSLLAVINAVLRMTRRGPASGTAPDAAPNSAGAAAAGSSGEGGAPPPHESKAAGAGSHLPDLTRLMSMLSHHVALPDVLLSCPEMLPHLLDFMQLVNTALMRAVRQLLGSGQPTRGLLSSLDPDDQLPWTLDYLTMVAGVADALCRLRDRREQPPPPRDRCPRVTAAALRDRREHEEFSSLLPAVDEAAWPLMQRYDFYNQP